MSKTRVRYDNRRRYRVTAPVEDYAKSTYGLKFNKGKATIDPEDWDNETKRTPEQVLDGIQSDFPQFAVEAYGSPIVAVPDMDHLRTTDGRLRTRADLEAEAEKPRRGRKTEE